MPVARLDTLHWQSLTTGNTGSGQMPPAGAQDRRHAPPPPCPPPCPPPFPVPKSPRPTPGQLTIGTTRLTPGFWSQGSDTNHWGTLSGGGAQGDPQS